MAWVVGHIRLTPSLSRDTVVSATVGLRLSE
jgi:hypothetical protein